MKLLQIILQLLTCLLMVIEIALTVNRKFKTSFEKRMGIPEEDREP